MLKYGNLVLGFLLLFSSLGFAGHQGDIPYCESLSNPESRAAVKLVHDAVALVSEKGEAAFDEFAVKGSRWFDGDRYVFVHDMEGVMVSNPAFPTMIGRQMLDFKDVTGKTSVRFMIDQVTKYGRNSGWVHYFWPPPGQVEPQWKSSFVHLARTPEGKEYVVGTGLYDVPMERCFVMQAVEDAATLIRRHGPSSFALLRSRAGPFVWKDSYVYVFGLDGLQYVHPIQPLLDGTDITGLVDADGENLFQKMVKATEHDGAGWLTYRWPRPGYVAPSRKISYDKRISHGGKDYVVGSGYYLD